MSLVCNYSKHKQNILRKSIRNLGKPMGAVSVFTVRNCLHKPITPCPF